MIGVEERTNGELGILRLHYTANPEYRAEDWAEQTRAALKLSKRQWRREFEIDWTIASGLPVYAEEFVRDWHVAKVPLLAYPELPVYRGWDIGPTHTQPAVAVAQFDPVGRLCVIGEFVTWSGRGDIRAEDVGSFADGVLLTCRQDWPGVEWVDYADPAGWTKSMTDNKSAVDILRGRDVHPRPGPVTFTQRREAMTAILTRSVQGAAALQVSPDCTMVIEGLAGAYRYEPVGETGRYKATVDKNAWSHVVNGLEYIVGSLYGKSDRETGRRRKWKGSRVTGY